MKTSLLLILAACGQSAPTVLVFQSTTGVELRVAFTKLRYEDVPLGLDCQVMAALSTDKSFHLLCGNEVATAFKCADETKQKHQVLRTQGREFSAWCE